MGRKSRAKKLKRILGELADHMGEHFDFEADVDPMGECETLYDIAVDFITTTNPDLSKANRWVASHLIYKVLSEYFIEKAKRLGVQDPKAYLDRAWYLED